MNLKISGKFYDCILTSLFFFPILFLYSQENSTNNGYNYLEIDGEVIKIKKESPKEEKPLPEKKISTNPSTKEDTYSPTKSQTKYNLKTKGMKIVELDQDGEPLNQGKRYAIVIGINDYKDIAISDLSKARYDAKAIAQVFKDQGQFDEVFVMTDDIDFNGPDSANYPTKLNIEERIDSLLRFANSEDLVVLFFSGHGISDYDENGYLVAVDTVADKAYNSSVKIEDIVQKFKKKGLKKTLLLLDACRDVLYNSKSANRNSIREKRYEQSEVSAIFYSTKAGFYSYEDDETDYGVFTKFLIYGMEGKADENRDGVVSFSELETFVQEGVKGWSIKKNKQQKPFTRLNSEKTGDLAITIANNPEKSLADKPVPKPSRSPYVLRSLVAPGWGQFYEDKRKRGYAFSILSGLLFLNYYTKDREFRQAQSDYKNFPILPAINGEGNVFLQNFLLSYPQRQELNRATLAANQAFTFLALVWGYNVLDAYFFKKEENFFNIQFSYSHQIYPTYPEKNSKLETIYHIEWGFRF